ncbi:hypothetical protein [Mycolicibacterium insubricum]|uniref:hypothetical protein n=1 Tax=Mycolicibacterium insubricum TaxID=444597 RepID=UPI0021F25F71|nr:hypothetical protein [Mycolicibacterium insubricum]MCV7082869.1 hypothetical protein [Mycolicibacterium insubricum]
MAQTPTGTPADGDAPDQDTATPPAGTGRVWGEAVAPGRWSGGKTLAAVAVATVLGAGGALVIHAAGGGSSGGWRTGVRRAGLGRARRHPVDHPAQ